MNKEKFMLISRIILIFIMCAAVAVVVDSFVQEKLRYKEKVRNVKKKCEDQNGLFIKEEEQLICLDKSSVKFIKIDFGGLNNGCCEY